MRNPSGDNAYRADKNVRERNKPPNPNAGERYSPFLNVEDYSRNSNCAVARRGKFYKILQALMTRAPVPGLVPIGFLGRLLPALFPAGTAENKSATGFGCRQRRAFREEIFPGEQQCLSSLLSCVGIPLLLLSAVSFPHHNPCNALTSFELRANHASSTQRDRSSAIFKIALNRQLTHRLSQKPALESARKGLGNR